MMRKSKFFTLISFLLLCLNLIGQDTVGVKDIFYENDLAFKISDNQRFTGVAQKVRKNGHIIFEDTFKDGVILSSVVYFNGNDKEISEKTFYNPYKAFALEKNIKYISNKDGKSEVIDYYNENGLKILEETKTEGVTTYLCEFLNGKKHGEEFCFDDNGNELFVQYKNGKKVKAKSNPDTK